MNSTTKTSAIALILTVGAATTWFATRSEGTPQEREQDRGSLIEADATPAPPAGAIRTAGVNRILRAVPFRLTEPYTHYYRADQPAVSEGWLVVLGVSPDLVRPTNNFQPVLYAGLPGGTQTLERINQGHIDGVTVAFLPGDIDDPSGLRGAPIWFGAPELPERLTEAMIETERERIADLDVFTITEAALRDTEPSSSQPGATTLALANRQVLEETAAELIIQYAPGDREFAEGFLID